MPSESGLCQMISPLWLSYLLVQSKQRHSSCCQLSWGPHESPAPQQRRGLILQVIMSCLSEQAADTLIVLYSEVFHSCSEPFFWHQLSFLYFWEAIKEHSLKVFHRMLPIFLALLLLANNPYPYGRIRPLKWLLKYGLAWLKIEFHKSNTSFTSSPTALSSSSLPRLSWEIQSDLISMLDGLVIVILPAWWS